MIPYDRTAPQTAKSGGQSNQKTKIGCNAAIGYKEQSVFVVKKLSAVKFPQVSGMLVPIEKDVLNDVRATCNITSYEIACNHDMSVHTVRGILADLMRRKLVKSHLVKRTTYYYPVVL